MTRHPIYVALQQKQERIGCTGLICNFSYRLYQPKRFCGAIVRAGALGTHG
jgi:hypothetical protein